MATYVLGGTLPNGIEISPKYLGSARLVEIAVASLATDRALLLLGVPGTAKTWLSEHLAAAISGTSTLIVQGTAGTPEEALRYGWNYARLLADGPSRAAMVAGPVMRAMETGSLVRVEELTRIPSDVQDSLITILSEKILPIPELNAEVQARKGFNVIATANNRDKESTTSHRHCAAASTPWCCRSLTPSTRKWRSSAPGSAASALPWSSQPIWRHSPRSAGWSPSCGNCAPG
ncbi:ATP-binding protein [Arthrobacter sp. SA17]